MSMAHYVQSRRCDMRYVRIRQPRRLGSERLASGSMEAREDVVLQFIRERGLKLDTLTTTG